jgi:hypothetical protein
MKTTKVLVMAAAAACFTLLAACGGSASKDAAGTLMEAKQPAADAPTENGAAGAGANVAADSATATDKNGKPANGGMYIQPGCKPVAGKDANGVYAVKVEC